MKAKFLFCAFSIAVLLNTGNGPIALAQNKTNPPTDRKPVSKITHRGAKAVKPDKFLDAVDKPPDMPGLTLPHGKYVYGFDNDNRNGGRNKGANFEVPDSPEAVANYYRGALSSGGWELCKEACKGNKVVAINKQLHCAVNITASMYRPGSVVAITYSSHR